MRLRHRFLIVGMLVVTLALGGCGAKTEAEDPGIKAIPVEVMEVTKGTVTVKDTVTGSLHPDVEVPVVPKLGGVVAQVAVSVGDQVKQGALLVQLDTGDIEAQVRQAEAAVETARTALVNAEAQIPNSLKIAQANYDAAKSAYERMEYLFSEGGISEQQLEGAKTQLDVAAAQLANAENAPLQLETVKAQLKQAEAAYEAAKTQLDNAYITAPVGGTVTAVHIEVGHMVGPTMPVVTVAQLDPVVGIFNLTESQVNKLKPGDGVEIHVSAAGKGLFPGKVTEVAPAADPRTRGYKIKVELPNGEGTLKSGMTAQVGLALESIAEELAVPVHSIVTKGNRQYIYLIEGEQVRECQVEILLQDGETAAVSGEVEAGAQVVIAGQNLLQDGTLVKVVSGEGK